MFLGLKNDPSVPVLKEYIRMNNLENYVDFLIDLSPTYNFTDQLFLAAHSEGYIGNGSGAAEIFFYLKKKALIFDHIFQKLFNLPHFLSYRRTLFKKISINNSEYKLLDEQLIKSATQCNTRNNYRIMENSYDDIIQNIRTFFL